MTILGYTVNFVDVAIVLLVILSAVHGCRRGLLYNVINFIRWSVGTFLCFFVSSNYSTAVYDAYVQPRLMNYINNNIATSGNIDEVLANLQKAGERIPKQLQGLFDFSSFTVSSDDIASSIEQNVFEPAAMALTKAGVFLAVFAVFFLITGILMLVIQHRNKKKDREGASVLRKTDSALGCVLGLIKGAVVVLALCSVLTFAITVAQDNDYNSEFLNYAKSSTLLNYIDEINPFNAITEGII